jgi:hypothetical protein
MRDLKPEELKQVYGGKNRPKRPKKGKKLKFKSDKKEIP